MKHLPKYKVISVLIDYYLWGNPHKIVSEFVPLSVNLSQSHIAEPRRGHSAQALLCVPHICEQHQAVMQPLGNLGYVCSCCEAAAAERMRSALVVMGYTEVVA